MNHMNKREVFLSSICIKILQYVSKEELLKLLIVSRSLRNACKLIFTQSFEFDLKIKEEIPFSEIARTILRFNSNKPKSLLQLLYWSIGKSY